MLCCTACRPGAYLLSPGGAFAAGFRSGADVDGAGDGADVNGPGCRNGNSLGTAALGAAVSGVAELGGVVTAGAGNDGATAGTTVVGTGFVADCDGQSMIFSTAVTIPKPTSGAARHERRRIRRLPIRFEKERPRPLRAAASIDSWVMSSCRCARSADGTTTGFVTSSATAVFRNESVTGTSFSTRGKSSYEQRRQGVERLNRWGVGHRHRIEDRRRLGILRKPISVTGSSANRPWRPPRCPCGMLPAAPSDVIASKTLGSRRVKIVHKTPGEHACRRTSRRHTFHPG
jgi:hypothetical protein